MDAKLQALTRNHSPEGQKRLLIARKRLGSTLMIQCITCLGSGVFPGGVDHYVCNGTGKVAFPWNERLCLASLCGHPGARLLVDWSCVDNYPFDAWLEKFKDYDIAILRRVAVVACEDWFRCVASRRALIKYVDQGGLIRPSYYDLDVKTSANEFLTAAKQYLAGHLFRHQLSYLLYTNTATSPCRLLVWNLYMDSDLRGDAIPRYFNCIKQISAPREKISKGMIEWVLQ